MGGELVTGSSSEVAAGGGAGRQPAFRYGEKFDALCGHYMSLGMSYYDYWDGDCAMAKYYREAAQYRQEYENTLAWLNGFYVYHALLDAAPVFNPMSKKKTPRRYLKEPVPITAAGNKNAVEAKNRKKLADGKNAMLAMMKGINAKIKKEGRD